jgi:N6-L-threonylcarbamoyladenine synthase
MAREANFQDFFQYPRSTAHSFDFSFSGLKTAVLYDLIARGWYDGAAKKITDTMTDEYKCQVASSLLVSVAEIFEKKIEKAIKEYPFIRGIGFVGGVACNRYIADRLRIIAGKHQLYYAHPSPAFCTDNAAMIAFVGSYLYAQGKLDDYSLDIL